MTGCTLRYVCSYCGMVSPCQPDGKFNRRGEQGCFGTAHDEEEERGARFGEKPRVFHFWWGFFVENVCIFCSTAGKDWLAKE